MKMFHIELKVEEDVMYKFSFGVKEKFVISAMERFMWAVRMILPFCVKRYKSLLFDR